VKKKLSKFLLSKTLIAYGNGKVHPMIKGYVKTPLKKLYMALKKNKNCSIFLTDEFRTTKLCSNCHEICLTSRSPHRFQVCQNCKKSVESSYKCCQKYSIQS